VALFAIRIHHRQLSATPSLAPLIAQLHAKLDAQLRRERTVIGFNLAVLRHLRDEAEAEGDGRLFDDALAARTAALQAAKEPGGAQPNKSKQGKGKGKSKGKHKPGEDAQLAEKPFQTSKKAGKALKSK
jgi:hypothetical protein